ncbi:MAG TPA: tRNA-uridine aminocarboxypropyltransferase [Polyangiaceae bacterium]|jgi:DTW domain-containing protein YfiP
MRSTTPRDLSGHCTRCLLNQSICVCAALPTVMARTEIVLIRHVAERWLTSNSGRFAALALPNARVLEYGGGEPFNESEIELAGSAVLFHTGTPALSVMPRRLIVLDASFRQASRMYKRIDALRALPVLSLPAAREPPARLRAPPHAAGMSTLEAVASALARLEGEELAQPLFALHGELVRRADALRGRNRAYPSGFKPSAASSVR